MWYCPGKTFVIPFIPLPPKVIETYNLQHVRRARQDESWLIFKLVGL